MKVKGISNKNRYQKQKNSKNGIISLQYKYNFKGGLYMKPDMKIDPYETEKKVISPSGQVYLNVYMFRNDMKFISG